MTKPRGGTSYRLSDDAQQLLGALGQRLGITKTSVLEMAIRKMAHAEFGEAVEAARPTEEDNAENGLPPGLRAISLTVEQAQTIRRVLNDPKLPASAGKEMPTGDASIFLNKLSRRR